MSPTEPPGGPDLGAVSRDIERVSRRVEELATLTQDLPGVARRVGELDESVEKLGTLLADVMERLRGSGEEPRSWLLLDDPQVARDILTDLVSWLDAVYLRYPNADLPVCWMWHPWVIEELWWLRCSHSESYSGRGWGSRAGMWHDQQRPRVVQRIREAIGTCDLREHVSAGRTVAAPIPAPLAGHLEVVADAWTSTGLPPEPTSEQIEDAARHETEVFERSHTTL